MSAQRENRQGKYFIEAVAKALDVLDCFERPEQELTLTEIAEKMQLSRSSTFRLLFTLEEKGWVERDPHGRKFRRRHRWRRHRVAYGVLSGFDPFAVEVSKSLEAAAEQQNMELLVSDNCYNPDIALMNAKMFVSRAVDFVIESQTSERVAPVIAHLFAEAKIPCLAIDIPQPGAMFFGADNYRAGLIAGRALGRWALEHWEGRVDKIILLELPQSGPVAQARMSGALNGIKEVFGAEIQADVMHVDGKGLLQVSFTAVGRILESLPDGSKILVAAFNDQSALGAVKALEAGRIPRQAVVVGHNGTLEARHEIRRTPSYLLGSVAYFPEKYGERIIPLVLRILAGEAVPPAVYVEHELLTRDTVDTFYPGDPAMPAKEDIDGLPARIEPNSISGGSLS